MKICILSSFADSLQRDSGASVRVYHLAKGLVKARNEVHVILPGEDTGTECVDGIFVHRFKGFFPNTVLKVLSRILGVSRPTSLYFYDFLFIERISKLISRLDIAQLEQQMAGGILVPYIRKILNKPVVVDFHDVFQALRVEHTGFLRRLLETFQEKLAHKQASLILTVSEEEKNRLLLYGVAESKIKVVPNGVNMHSPVDSSDSPNIRSQYGLEGCRNVIFVGNMEYLPNWEAVQLLSSVIAPIVQEAVKNARFLAVGRTSGKTELRNVVFTGFVKNVPDFLGASEVAVAPLLHGSGTKLKILEYFSAGLPVVSTSIGAEGLDVNNGSNIFIENDLRRFAERIIQLLADKDLSTRLGRAAKKLVENKYNWKTIAKELDHIYRYQL